MKPEFLEKYATSIIPVGSRVTCNPAPTDTDEDWLVLIPSSKLDNAINELDERGFQLEHPSSHYEPSNNEFNSWRGPDKVNLIITRYWQFKENFLLATKVCSKLNLMNKQDRITLFQAILYGRFA